MMILRSSFIIVMIMISMDGGLTSSKDVDGSQHHIRHSNHHNQNRGTSTTDHHHHHHRRKQKLQSTRLSYGLTQPINAGQSLTVKRKSRGKYTMKEEVIKKVEAIHPCSLTKTAVKVTFPGMKSEVLVSFLGYKEPNLMHVNRCKGRCSSSAIGRVACIPIKRKMKKVRMHLTTQVLGSTKKKDKFRELILEEHEECGCECLTISPNHCLQPGLFNNDTCSCRCDNSLYQRDKLQCEALSTDRTWDPTTCACRRKDEVLHQSHLGPTSGSSSTSSISDHQQDAHYVDLSTSSKTHEMALDSSCAHCMDCMNAAGMNFHPMNGNGSLFSSFYSNSWTTLGILSFFIGLFASTTFHYWRKSRRLQAKDPIEVVDVSNIMIDDPFGDHQIQYDHNGDGNKCDVLGDATQSGTPSIPTINYATTILTTSSIQQQNDNNHIGNNTNSASRRHRSKNSNEYNKH